MPFSVDIWQSFCVLIILMALPFCISLTCFLLMNNLLRWPFLIGYSTWTLLLMRRPWWNGKRFKNVNWLVTGLRGYFEGAKIKFIDKSEVEKVNGPMIYCCHPHGIFGLSTLINFAIGSDYEGITALLPSSCPIHVLTLRLSFLIPFWRDLLVGFGLGPVDKNSCRQVLKEAGHGIAVVVGGAREALYSHPGRYEIILEERKGIFKLSVEENVPIIPVFSFGDVDLYDQIILPWPVSLLQRLSMKFFGFSMPMPTGRFGTILPFRRRLFTVIGKPIHPNGRDVNELHSVYKEQLIEIFSSFESKKTLIIN